MYLALPTGLLEPVLTSLATVGLRASDAVAIEKPFGSDLASARHLNEILRTRMPLPNVFRIDHFLSDDLVRQVVALRFANRIFEPTWNATHVERVEISWLESLTPEGRASYYDKAGALKDMVQNHLMEALRTVAAIPAGEMSTRTVRARYGAGRIGSRAVAPHIEEPGVDPRRDTETYASVTVGIDSARWHGVPFTLRSGKAMPEDAAEIAIHYRTPPGYLLERYPGLAPNVLRLGLMQPYVRMEVTTLGISFCVAPISMRLSLDGLALF